MNSYRSTSPILALILTCLLFGACSEDAPTTPSSPLIGTWIIMESEGVDVSSLQSSYTFTETEATLTWEEGCQTKASYVISGSSMIATLISDACYNRAAGSRDTTAFSVNGDQLRLVAGSDTIVLQKGTPNPIYLKGEWTVESFNGQAVPAGSGMTLNFSFNKLMITGTGLGACSALFTFTKDLGGLIYLNTQADGCFDTLEGDSFEGTYTLTATSLSLMFNDMTIVARRG